MSEMLWTVQTVMLCGIWALFVRYSPVTLSNRKHGGIRFVRFGRYHFTMSKGKTR